MNRLSLIISREYLSTVGKKSFIVMTLLIPILTIALCGVLPVLLSQVKSSDMKTIAVVDQSMDGRYAALLADDDEFHFVKVTPSGETPLYDFNREHDGEFYAIVQIPDSLERVASVQIFSSQSIGAGLGHSLTRQLRPELQRQRVSSFGIEGLDKIIEECDVNLDIRSMVWDEKGEENLSSSEISSVLGLLLALLTYTFVLMYGAMIMNGVIEEKTNRIVEVIVSSCKPMELMLGKIIGVALVGLTQLAIWGALFAIASVVLGVSVFGSAASSPEMQQAMAEVQTASQDGGKLAEFLEILRGINFSQILTCFVLYFIGGYLLYASMFAAFGSAVDQPSDASQFTWPIMMVMIFALYAGMFSMENPDGPLAWWCSMIPLTSPIVMMIRLPYDVPFSELVISIVLLYATAFGILYLAGRIYRTGILMYGKKFTVKDILRWVKMR